VCNVNFYFADKKLKEKRGEEEDTVRQSPTPGIRGICLLPKGLKFRNNPDDLTDDDELDEQAEHAEDGDAEEGGAELNQEYVAVQGQPPMEELMDLDEVEIVFGDL